MGAKSEAFWKPRAGPRGATAQPSPGPLSSFPSQLAPQPETPWCPDSSPSAGVPPVCLTGEHFQKLEINHQLLL